jgi:putative DNA primase/helicase
LNILVDQLGERRCFILARLVPRADGSVDKVPVNVEGQPVSALDPANWMTGRDAALRASVLGCGVGLVITESGGLACVDIDKAWDGRAWAPHVSTILGQFPGAYVEVSQSGQGLHVIFACKPVPSHKTRNAALHLECYTRSRFIYLTGTHARGDARLDMTPQLVQFIAQHFGPADTGDASEWTDSPVPEWRGPGDDAELIQRALRSNSAQAVWGSRASFADLWGANADVLARCFPSPRDDAFNRSAADQALANWLAFYTGKNAERMLRLMRQSALVRPKWERADYMRSTILRACADAREVYSGRASDGPTASVPAPPGTAVVPAPRSASIELARAADIKPEAIRWLWVGWLPSGKLVILAGAPGTGKSTITFTLAAIVSRGSAWPDNAPSCSPANVLIWSGEDDAADTIVPRLMAAGADLQRVHIIRGKVGTDGQRAPFDPATDMAQLEQTITAIGGAALLIIDPVVSAVAGDMNKSNEVRRSLQALVDLGAKFDCAVVGITHFRKGSQGATPHERVLGSQAFGALARLVLIAAESEENGRRVFARAKSNISKDRGGIEYSLVPEVVNGDIATIRINWGAAVEGTAREILKEAEREPDTIEEGECAQALAMALRDSNGRPVEVPKQIIEQQLKQAGYSEKQIRKAREKLKIVTWLVGFGPASKGMWRLPEGTAPR